MESYILIVKSCKNHENWKWKCYKKMRSLKCYVFSSSCNKWKSFWDFLVSSSRSFCLWNSFFYLDLLFCQFLCVQRSTDFINLAFKKVKRCRLSGQEPYQGNMLHWFHVTWYSTVGSRHGVEFLFRIKRRRKLFNLR